LTCRAAGLQLCDTCLLAAAEKNLKVLREVLEALPGAHLTFVGDGPFRPDLEAHFAGCRVTFTVHIPFTRMLDRLTKMSHLRFDP
jgi:hypothetical protein